MKSHSLAWALVPILGLLALLIPEIAMAQPLGPPAPVDSLGNMANKMVEKNTFGALFDLMTGFAYLAGAWFGVKAALQLRDNTENPQQTRLSKPMTSMGVSGILLGLPSFIDMVSLSAQSVSGISSGTWLDTVSGFAGGGGSASGLDGVAVAFAASLPALMNIVKIGAMAAGIFLILRAILWLPQMEQGRVEPGKIAWTLTSGAVLWSLLPMIDMVMHTQGQTSQTTNLLTAHYNATSGGGFNATIAAVLTFIQLIGFIAFVRGTLILKAIGDNKDGTMGRALTHILGGAAAMNIGWTVKMLATTIGSQAEICGLATSLCNF